MSRLPGCQKIVFSKHFILRLYANGGRGSDPRHRRAGGHRNEQVFENPLDSSEPAGKSPHPQEIGRDNRLSQEARFWRFQTKSGNWHGRQYPSCRSLRTGLEPRRLQKSCWSITSLSQISATNLYHVHQQKRKNSLHLDRSGDRDNPVLPSIRYALNEKEAKTRERPGNFDGNTTAQGTPFDPLPETVAKNPRRNRGVFRQKRIDLREAHSGKNSKWVIETSGAFCARKDFSSSSSKTPRKKTLMVSSVPQNCMKSTIELAWPVKPLALLRLAAKACKVPPRHTLYRPKGIA